MTLIELKRILLKAPVLILCLFIVPVFAATALVTGIDEPKKQTEPEKSLDEIRMLIWTETDYASELLASFSEFENTMDTFWGYGTSQTSEYYSEFLAAFDGLNTAFINFNTLARNYLFTGPVSMYIQIEKDSLKQLKTALDAIAANIEFEEYGTLSISDIDAKRYGLSLAWEDKGGNKISGILEHAETLKLSESDRENLKNMYNKAVGTYGQSSDIAFEYLDEHYRKYTGLNYSEDEIKILSYMTEHGYTWHDYSRPYSFGKPAHTETGTTPFDFVFNNFELLALPLIVFGILLTVFCIFLDIKNNTIIAPLIAPQSRTRVILAKLSACALTVAVLMALYFLLYYLTAVTLLGTVTPPAIITAFGGAVIKMSPLLLLLFYMLSLFFKVLFFMWVTAFICINAYSIRSIVIKVIIIAALILGLNLTLTVLLPVGIYQYSPLLGLDFAGSFGIGLAFVNITLSSAVLFALPIMLFIWALITAGTIIRFGKRDF